MASGTRLSHVTEIEKEARFAVLTDEQLLDELAVVSSAILSRVVRYEVQGLDPDYADRPPNARKLEAGLGFAAKAEAIADHFVSGTGESDSYHLVGWTVGLKQIRNELAGKALSLAQGCDPRTEVA